MNLIKKELIEEAAEKEVPLFPVEYEEYIAKNSFKSGVEFAESQLEKLAIEFAEWLFLNSNKYSQFDTNHFMYVEKNELWSTQEVFQQFIKRKK